MTKLRKALLAATVLTAAAPFSAKAQPITGLYIGAGAGYNLMGESTGSVDTLPGRSSLGSGQAIKIKFKGGGLGVGSIGYGVGNGVRLELEGSYRSNSQDVNGSNGSETKYGLMANAMYDISIGRRWIYPYIGLGFGYQLANWSKIQVSATGLDYGQLPTTVSPSGTIGAFAYQAIIGAAFPVSAVPGLSFTAEYRYLGLAGNRNYSGTGYTQYISSGYTNNKTRVHASNDSNHSFLVGFRYAFDPDGSDAVPAATGVPMAPISQVVPAAPSAARTYLIFFDFDRADLTPRARDIVAEAVRNSARVQHTRIDVSGHADRTGDEAYNQRLSLARAQAVATELGRWGVPPQIIDIRGYGDTRPLVPTAAGVREPQNRRVEIVYR